MAAARVERRLAAILAADVAGYSRLMGADEVGTLAALRALRRELVDPAIAAHKGRIVKTTGDGMLVEFASAVDAVTCATEVQAKMSERKDGVSREIRFRVGINIGDIIVEGDDIFGDGVNVAARIENECEPGGVCLSSSAFEQVRDKTSFVFDDLGEKRLKNIDRPVRLYAIQTAAASLTGASKSPAKASNPLPLPDKPSIAVLPFQNMSGDPEQEYFADGTVEEITTALSRFNWLFVIARTSTFAYKGRAIDAKQVSRELGVRYLLEGSVRKSGNRVRITGQLIDTATGAHLWADRFEGSLDNIFELQDQVASGVVGAIDPKLLEAEIARVKRKPVASLDAYDCFLRASDLIYRWTDESHEEALRLLYQAIELDPEYSQAYAFASYCYVWRWSTGRLPAAEYGEARRLAREAIKFGRDDGFSLAWGGSTLAFFARTMAEVKEGAAIVDRGLLLNPNLARSWNLSGWVRIMLGRPDLAIEHLERAMRLSPLDFAFHAMEAATAHAHLAAGRFHEAMVWAERSLRDQPNQGEALTALMIASAMAGDVDKARTAMKHLAEIRPHRRISNFFLPRVTPEGRAPIEDILRRIGMPE
jgi:TolB-like protein/class 3 adenylate cyclase/Tfp pilus assembly protein PilF